MSHWVKIKDFRVDLDTIFSYQIRKNTSFTWPYRVELFPKFRINHSSGNNSIVISWPEKSNETPAEFQEARDMLDQYFLGKTEKESEILP